MEKARYHADLNEVYGEKLTFSTEQLLLSVEALEIFSNIPSEIKPQENT